MLAKYFVGKEVTAVAPIMDQRVRSPPLCLATLPHVMVPPVMVPPVIVIQTMIRTNAPMVLPHHV
jgi:hypothetical protein